MFYSAKFKERVVGRLLEPGAPGVGVLAREVGVCTSTLYRWRNASLLDVSSDDTPPEPPPKKRAELTALEKIRLLVQVTDLHGEDRGAFLRRHGLHEADLDEWQRALDLALDPAAAKKHNAEEKKKVARLEKELKRKDKALAEAAALLVLRKKAQALWGDEDDDTEPT
jgi:transposase